MKVILLSITILFNLSPSRAQVGDSGIQGMIRDLSGAPVPHASVYAVDLHNIRRRSSTTADSDGRFVLRNVPPGSYSVHAYKESEGYPDTFFSFFDVGNHKAWRMVEVPLGRTVDGIILELGPKYAILKISINDEQGGRIRRSEDERGNPVGPSLTFARPDDPNRPYGVGFAPELLVPPVPFRLHIKAEGYQIWNSKLIKARPGETVSLIVHMKRSR